MRDNKDTRVFFALWPDAVLRESLSRAALTIPIQRPARRVPDYNLHLTLHFIGNVYLDQLACLQRQARRVKGAGFDLVIDTQGCFDKSRVAWLGCSEVPTALRQLHQQLGRRLQQCDYRPEARRYNPHVTVARKIRSVTDSTDFAALPWRVENFVLIESKASDNGVKYRVIETYPLS